MMRADGKRKTRYLESILDISGFEYRDLSDHGIVGVEHLGSS